MKQYPINRLIGKIDNDFNIDQSDWIPRVGAWVIDALSQMKVLPKQRKKRELKVHDKIAVFPCELDEQDIKVYTSDGCEIERLTSQICCNNSTFPYGGGSIGVTVNSKNDYDNVSVGNIVETSAVQSNRNYVISGCNKIELNYETDSIIVESNEIATYFDEYFGCEMPYIYDNGLLLEALEYYCIYKMLCRGYSHQVFSLTAREPCNPYIHWIQLKDKAAASVKIDISKNKDKGWNNFFYNSTFLPRND